MSTFEDGQPEELLTLIKNFIITIYGTGIMPPSEIINYLRTILHGEALRKFDELTSQNNASINSQLNHIKEGLLGFFSINALSKQKRAMRFIMRKPQSISSKYFSVQLTEINNYLPLLPGSINDKKMALEDPNKTLIHAVLNLWLKKYYLQG